MKKILDLGNIVVILLTALLFIIALFLKGITKDLLLEAGVLLVSIKLIMFNYKQSLFNEEALRQLSELQNSLSERRR